MVSGALADGFNHRNSRTGRRQSFRSGRQRSFRRPAFRRGRQEELDAAAPIDGYGGAQDAYGGATEAPEVLPPPEYDTYDDAAAGALGAYGADDAALGVYAADDAAADPNLAMLEKAVPGIPGEDYPIFAEVPESGFSCDGQVDGGYYADAEAQCQVFHICTADGQGGLAKYSFLCPNGTIFNQNYFICDWWFNFDCAEAEGLYSLNDEIAAERDALAGAGDEALGGYGAPGDEAAAPLPTDYEYTDYAAADYGAADYAAAGDYAAATAPADDYSAQSEYAATEAAPTEAPIETGYGAPGELDAAASADALLPTVAPELGAYEGEDLREGRRGRFSGRRGRGRSGRRGGRRGRTGRNRSLNSRRNNRRQNNRRGNNSRRSGRRQGRRFQG